MAWGDWFERVNGSSRLAKELDLLFGPKRDLFIDSGGFQLLYADKIDLSPWGMEVTPEDIFRFQMEFSPQRVASLDSPVSPKSSQKDAAKLIRLSIKNAVLLAESIDTVERPPIPYLVVHGRNPDEVRRCLQELENALPRGWLRRERFGIAIGSQVPLKTQPRVVVENVRAVLRWMRGRTPDDTPLHIFGVGDALIGEIRRHSADYRTLSYDNSTYIQNAFRMKVFDSETLRYRPFDPFGVPYCECAACDDLAAYGSEFISGLMSRPPYQPAKYDGERVNRSDVLALLALHNLNWWRSRLELRPPRIARSDESGARITTAGGNGGEYTFPLRDYKTRGELLLLLACSKMRPYAASRSHRRIVNYLESTDLHEAEHFDRITLSGLYGPVHWMHEEHPVIMSYEFRLTPTVSEEHVGQLRVKTGTVLGGIVKKYRAHVAYIPSRAYRDVFSPVLQRFGVPVVRTLDELTERFLTFEAN